jgi:carbon-monoxide dehydrogenase large subunit
MSAGRFMGQSVVRREDARLLTGRGRYIADIELPRMLHATFVRSDIARGRILSLDLEEARSAPGVVAVLAGSDLNPMVRENWWYMAGREAMYPPRTCLAEGDVRYVGDPIAIVIAESRYLAEDAADLVQVDIEPAAPVLDVRAAMAEGADLVHPENGTNTPGVFPVVDDAEMEAAFRSAAHVVTETFDQHRYLPVPMETRGIIADWNPITGEMHIWNATQSAHEVRGFYARLLGLRENAVRVTNPDVGGGFGLKTFSLRDEWSVVLASQLLGRPVKWIEDRRENLMAGAGARDESMTVSMALDEDGRILAMRAENLENIGAYPFPGPATTGPLIAKYLSGPYRVPHIAYSGASVYTNTAGRAAYRGPFLMATVGPEQLMDVAARRLSIDPLELRRRNVLHTSELPFTMGSGEVLQTVTPEETLEQAAEMIGYDDFRAMQREARAEGRLLGIGIALCVEPSALSFGPLGTESAFLRADPSGHFYLSLGSSDTGMSLATTMAQVVADQLGCDVDDVTVLQGDTAHAPYGAGTQGSRSAVLYGNVAQHVARTMQEKLRIIAAHVLEAEEDDLEFDAGQVTVRGTSSGVPLARLTEIALATTDDLPLDVESGLEVTHRFKPYPITWCNACHVCTVEVDKDSGLVRILRYVVSEDCGQMINPKVVHGQITGGVMQGIGGVLYEHMPYDADGNPLAGTFIDYLLPTTMETPHIEIGHITSPSTNPMGVKGVGEGGAVASPAAVFNAVSDALAHLGVELRSTPLGPRQILEALSGADGSS